ncbi:MAG: hypothetical protein HY707_02990 [Ignavibacteriae bacterium]|nr:hypothetical protein [Ignavibacteriota bacterium]
MSSYLIVSPHTPEECLKTIDHVLAAGYLTHFQWACKSGEHKGYLIFEAPNKNEALMVVPPFVRGKARVIELTQFSPEQVKAMHGMKK